MSNRRKFLKQLGGTAGLFSAASLTSLSADKVGFAAKEQYERKIIAWNKKYSPNDKIRIAGIGRGIMGYNDVNTAIKVPGVELVACCDLYTGRLEHAKELYSNNIFATRHYEEILERKDIDAVIVATSDNWHSHICIDAMKKGKGVYSEKPVVHHIDQGWEVIHTQQMRSQIFR